MKRKLDYSLLFIILALVVTGILMVYSASNVTASFKYSDAFYYLKRQLLFSIVGIILMIKVSKINLDKLKEKSTLIFIISLVLLILVLIPGIGSIRGGACRCYTLK